MLSYMFLVGFLFVRVTQSQIIERAHQEYEKRSTMLVLICCASVLSIITIIQEMRIGANTSGWIAGFHIGLKLFTLILSWLFIHTLFALYYAHGYYEADNNDHYPLIFPMNRVLIIGILSISRLVSVPQVRPRTFLLQAERCDVLALSIVYYHSFLIPRFWR